MGQREAKRLWRDWALTPTTRSGGPRSWRDSVSSRRRSRCGLIPSTWQWQKTKAKWIAST